MLDQSDYQIYLDKAYIDSMGKEYKVVKSFYIDQLNKNDNILLAFDNESISLVNLPEVYKEMFQNGYYQKLAGDVQLIYKPGYIFSYNASGTTQKKWNSELNAYRSARAQGIQPNSTKRKDIEAAHNASERLGSAYDGGTMVQAKKLDKKTAHVMKELKEAGIK